ncbi:uncharacterized protein B0H18DRAFT_1091431 [Fomitopsis serialis]|uniref:uncharacterized protein n=1 Tax=Fomitopsis serialis TaxID=139415 RepID=UPI00200867D9|nr:uncharacterized protein B0H18DRAFT_1091431 [Neoantrodia serialis]KAH9937151.1 hypothetical protein B0H18DRAFT_1091431 [Neoantrodia serialis]
MSTATATSTPTTLWATASKEWVIPAKPKPGRKPKKDSAPAVQDTSEVRLTPLLPMDPLTSLWTEQTDSKGRRVQNRAAQRAFRERKQSQLAELQARVQQFEQGEIERNVALQNIAKRLKEDNEKLLRENALLKDKLAQLEDDVGPLDNSKKRTRNDSTQRSPSLPSAQLSRKKTKVSPEPPSRLVTSMSPASSYDAPSPASSVSSSHPSSHTSFSPLPSQDSRMSNSMFDISNNKNELYDGGMLSCGFCNETTSCVCKDLALQTQVSEQLTLSDPPRHNAPHLGGRRDSSLQPSILDNLPQYQAPVPLRRRSPANPTCPVFPVAPPPTSSSSTASCSGDPSNCLACADDAFGKAFCDAIGKSVATSSSSCGYCPDPAQPTESAPSPPSANGCCGDPLACGGVISCAPTTHVVPHSSLQDSNMSDSQGPPETVSCDTAWRQIKAHPNVAFTDLSLLADVVARRSKCSGPRVEIVPAPGAVTPERGLSPAISSSHAENGQSIMLSDPRAPYDSRQGMGVTTARSPPPHCGRQRVREVMADGVHDALRLLDAKFPLSARQNYMS